MGKEGVVRKLNVSSGRGKEKPLVETSNYWLKLRIKPLYVMRASWLSHVWLFSEMVKVSKVAYPESQK